MRDSPHHAQSMARRGRSEPDLDPSVPLRGATVADRIKAARLRAGLRKADLAKMLEVTWQTINNWEKGRPPKDLDTLQAIADATGFPLDQITSGSEDGVSMPDAMRQALDIYARSRELTASQLARIAALTLEYRGGPPTDPVKYISLFEHTLNDGGEPVRAEETEAKAKAQGVRKVRRQRKN